MAPRALALPSGDVNSPPRLGYTARGAGVGCVSLSFRSPPPPSFSHLLSSSIFLSPFPGHPPTAGLRLKTG